MWGWVAGELQVQCETLAHKVEHKKGKIPEANLQHTHMLMGERFCTHVHPGHRYTDTHTHKENKENDTR